MSKKNDLNNLDLYDDDIRDIKVLNKDEEIELFRRCKSGDASARNELILSNLKLVRKLALKYKKLNISFEDLLQDSFFDLLAAIDNFDIEKGYKFSTYAYHCLNFRMKEHVDMQCRRISVSRREALDLAKVKRSYYQFANVNGRFPNIDELSSFCSMKKDKIIELILPFSTLSIDGVINDNYYECMEQDDFEYVDIYKTANYIMDSSVDVENEICSKINYEFLKKIILETNILTKTEKRNIICLFGFEDGVIKTETEVANIYGVSSSAIWYSLKTAYAKLSKNIRVRSFR